MSADSVTGLPTPDQSVGGAKKVVSGAFASGPIYEDATYKYFASALPGAALTAAVWQVSRMNKITFQVMWADGNGLFDNVFTDLATVAALAYS
jgi:hypothetical protein